MVFCYGLPNKLTQAAKSLWLMAIILMDSIIIGHRGKYSRWLESIREMVDPCSFAYWFTVSTSVPCCIINHVKFSSFKQPHSFLQRSAGQQSGLRASSQPGADCFRCSPQTRSGSSNRLAVRPGNMLENSPIHTPGDRYWLLAPALWFSSPDRLARDALHGGLRPAFWKGNSCNCKALGG